MAARGNVNIENACANKPAGSVVNFDSDVLFSGRQSDTGDFELGRQCEPTPEIGLVCRHQ
jgi:hypothetical protein